MSLPGIQPHTVHIGTLRRITSSNLRITEVDTDAVFYTYWNNLCQVRLEGRVVIFGGKVPDTGDGALPLGQLVVFIAEPQKSPDLLPLARRFGRFPDGLDDLRGSGVALIGARIPDLIAFSQTALFRSLQQGAATQRSVPDKEGE